MFKALFSTLVTDTKAHDIEGVGRERVESDGNKYRWVQNKEADSTDFALGQIAFHKLSDAGNMMKNVYVGLTANLSVMAGVVMGALQGSTAGDTPTNTKTCFGWVQIFGVNTSVSVSGATTGGTNIAAGDYLKGANSVVYAVRDAATQALYRRNLQILSAVATTTTPAAALVSCLINCS